MSAEDPTVWPECSECATPYVHRRALSFTAGRVWVWQADCKHGRKGTVQPAPILVNAEGPVPVTGQAIDDETGHTIVKVTP